MNIQGLKEQLEAKIDDAVNSFVDGVSQLELANEDERELMGRMLTMLDALVERFTYSEIFGVEDATPEWEQRMNEAAQSLAENFQD